MTGDADADDVRTWLQRHHCPVIRKPFNLKEVSDWLAAVIEFRERRREQGGAQA
jgi:DNA-binding NtrC family response regulator